MKKKKDSQIHERRTFWTGSTRMQMLKKYSFVVLFFHFIDFDIDIGEYNIQTYWRYYLIVSASMTPRSQNTRPSTNGHRASKQNWIDQLNFVRWFFSVCGYCSGFGFCFCFGEICVEHSTTMNEKNSTRAMKWCCCVALIPINKTTKWSFEKSGWNKISRNRNKKKHINKLRQLFQFRLFYYVLLNELKFISCIFLH